MNFHALDMKILNNFLHLKFWALSILLCYSVCIFGQQHKDEKEESIPHGKLPHKAAVFLKKHTPKKAKKYYRETDGEKVSYEAKFDYKDYLYSVEFDSIGIFLDAEVVIEEEDLPKTSLTVIKKYLNRSFDQFKIEKIQAQFLPKRSAQKTLKKALQIDRFPPDNYEYIVAVKIGGKIKKFELLFTYNGDFLLKRKVIRNNYDYLLF